MKKTEHLSHGPITKANKPERTRNVLKRITEIHQFFFDGEIPYDFSKFVYEGSKIKSTVICKHHGEFEIMPNSLLTGKGCKGCGYDRAKNKNLKNLSSFVHEARKVHSLNKEGEFPYDYSDFEYKNNKTPGIVNCLIHGKFKIRPQNHLGYGKNTPQGCPDCGKIKSANSRTTTFAEFKKLVIAAHPVKINGKNIYDLSGANWKNLSTNIDVYCRKHNAKFSQFPGTLIRGQSSCKQCALEKFQSSTRKGREAFIKEAKLHPELRDINGREYNYSEFKYENSNTKGTIICPTHGKFKITPNAHLSQRQGCRWCGISRRSDRQRKRFLDFKIEARKQHPQKYQNEYLYDYSEFIYDNNKTTGKITCRRHGEFSMSPNAHLGYKKQGCRECWLEELSRRKTRPEPQVIEEAQSIHKSEDGSPLYLYTKFKYTNTHTKAIITCRKHGDFKQAPNSHISQKQGCPKCSQAHYSKISVEFFKKVISKSGKQKSNFMAAFINGEFKVKSEKGWYSVDFFYEAEKKIIEFYGDYYHANPDLWKKQRIEVGKSGKTLIEIHEYDKIRQDLIQEQGYEMLIIWQNRWVNFPEEAVKEALEFLNFS